MAKRNDLISRDRLMTQIYYEEYSTEEKVTWAEAYRYFYGMIEKFPAAYSVDNVVERMEEIREEILTDTAYDNDTINHYLEYADLMIEDVKAGGVHG